MLNPTVYPLMEFVRFLNRAETLSKLNGQGKVGKAAL